MTGSLQEKKGYFYAVLNFTDKENKRKLKWIATGLAVKGNKRKAQQRLSELLVEYGETDCVEPTKILFCDFMVDWVETRKPNLQGTTYSNYKYLLNKHVYPYFKHLGVTLHKLTPLHIQQYYDEKVKSGLSPNTVIRHHALIRSSLAYAMKLRLIKENVADLVDKPKKQKFTGQFYVANEINRLITVAKGTAIETPVMLAAYFGLRRSEVLGLKWGAIDFGRRLITVNHKMVPITQDGKSILSAADELKTKSSYRSFPMNDFFYNYLLELKGKQDRNRKLFGNAYNNEYIGYVCVNDEGALIHPNYLTKAFSRLLTDNGLRKIRFHDLRHSCASLLLSLGCGMKDIQGYLGHGDIGTTMNIYAHLDSDSKKSIIAGLSGVLKLE